MSPLSFYTYFAPIGILVAVKVMFKIDGGSAFIYLKFIETLCKAMLMNSVIHDNPLY